MIVAVVRPAQWNGEFVADFAAQGPRLGEPKVVRIGWATSANQARMRGNELQMRLVAMSARLAERKLAFNNFLQFFLPDRNRGRRFR